jgi:hypothetical protein
VLTHQLDLALRRHPSGAPEAGQLRRGLPASASNLDPTHLSSQLATALPSSARRPLPRLLRARYTGEHSVVAPSVRESPARGTARTCNAQGRSLLIVSPTAEPLSCLDPLKHVRNSSTSRHHTTAVPDTSSAYSLRNMSVTAHFSPGRSLHVLTSIYLSRAEIAFLTGAADCIRLQRLGSACLLPRRP